jgi:RNA-directed DNA polymerase
VNLKKQELLDIRPEKSYHTFQRPKHNSTEKRTIEAPYGLLKYVLERFADGLQWWYHDHKTDAAFGYVRSSEYENDKRNIYTNARKHLGMKYLVNVDFDDFFHQVDTIKVRNMFSDNSLFSFFPETELLLTQFVTYKGRLPMGSPTSPPLSNFATISLDQELLKWAGQNEITYTRYVDDLSFSSKKPITDQNFEQILQITGSFQFKIDPEKTKWFGKEDPKEITGLIVGKSVTIPDRFLKDFEKSLLKMKEVCNFTDQLPDAHVFEWIEKMKKMMHGRLAFISSVYGKNHPVFLRLRDQLQEIENHEFSDDIEESLSWRYAGYAYY